MGTSNGFACAAEISMVGGRRHGGIGGVGGGEKGLGMVGEEVGGGEGGKEEGLRTQGPGEGGLGWGVRQGMRGGTYLSAFVGSAS